MNEKDRSEALKVVDIIGDILQAAHEGCEEAYDHVGQTAMPDKLFRKLSDALDKADELPDIGDEYVRPGWKTAIDTLRILLAVNTPVDVVAVAVTRRDEDEGFVLDWTLEGGIAELEHEGVVLYACPERQLTEDDGHGSVVVVRRDD